MTSRNKIDQLCQALLEDDSYEEPAPTPKTNPANEPVNAPVTEVSVMEVPAAKMAPAPTMSAEEIAAKHKADEAMRALIEERDQRIGKRVKMQRMAVWLILLSLMGGAATSYCVSPTLQSKCARFVDHLKEGRNDLKTMGSMTGQYDEALEEIGEHGSRIDQATASLGVDPSTVDPNEDPNMESEMKMLMGEDGVTTTDRNRSLQNTFGIVKTVVGEKEQAH